MNWNTKAKTRAGRGRSRDDLENQQRLAAWNKLPKRKINGRAMITITENSDMLPLNAVTAQRNQFSDDMLMLGSKVSEYRTQDDHLLFEQTSSFKSPSKKEPSDDPLLLLEFTVKLKSRSLIDFIQSFIIVFKCDLARKKWKRWRS